MAKSVAELFAEQQAREAISQRYIDPASLNPDRQEQIDRNRIPGEIALAFDAFDYGRAAVRRRRSPGLQETFGGFINRSPLQAVLTAAALGFAIALIVR